ncbi:Tetratricopeptide TPR_2 repeat protein [Melioribacter roseus P3M-2]|uniref:Tetratricopeptide TPR_2 repeat protein n=1 Tax=Melioribacter roseus (strain DSM 23840 / JCM 17771 / VKM B-2668 / P3M-2) TaxID=1191523 RepID=I6ZW40_MELRP|nr:tetratricopeptide repeat protein [Melioribacter roseus]AFN73293.1 Tetratricopeptide TPR_2 repeat protein [Melioribacter roseus P3M-2]
MKHLKYLLMMTYLLGVSSLYAQNQLMANFSLFYEYHKNKDYVSAAPYGWKVINEDPSQFIKYKIFPKMEETLWYLHDSTNATDDEKKALTDTILYFYDKAIQYEPDLAGYYLARKAYVMEVWADESAEKIIPVYEEALAKDPELPAFYKDRLGILYIKSANEENGYKLKALDLYSKLSEAEPDNPLWIQKLESIAENIEELVEITKKSWDLDKENLEKAWKYASTCLRAQDYEKAVEPLEFLTQKAPDVINYWKQLASAYDKLDKTDKAINAYKKVIELQPDGKENYVNLALIYKRLDQLSVARTYLQKAMKIDPQWDYPYLIEAQLYEQAARSCDYDFMAKCVYQLAVDTYRKAASLGGQYATVAADRVKALQNSVPTKEDYFFRKLKSGDTIKIEGACYSWIDRSIQVP